VTRSELLDRVAGFIRSIGIEVRIGTMFRDTLVPGIDIVEGALLIEPERLCQPADLLHEAGHIALTAPALRKSLGGTIGSSPAEEISAIAWTWGASRFLEIEPSLVFHEEVISGNGPTLLENFSAGRYVGVPLLQLWGLTLEPKPAAARGLPPYPHMLRWMRE
jgi:hypothetical protein